MNLSDVIASIKASAEHPPAKRRGVKSDCRYYARAVRISAIAHAIFGWLP